MGHRPRRREGRNGWGELRRGGRNPGREGVLEIVLDEILIEEAGQGDGGEFPTTAFLEI